MGIRPEDNYSDNGTDCNYYSVSTLIELISEKIFFQASDLADLRAIFTGPAFIDCA